MVLRRDVEKAIDCLILSALNSCENLEDIKLATSVEFVILDGNTSTSKDVDVFAYNES